MECLRQDVIGHCKHVPDLQRMMGLEPTTTMADLERLADTVIAKIADEID